MADVNQEISLIEILGTDKNSAEFFNKFADRLGILSKGVLSPDNSKIYFHRDNSPSELNEDLTIKLDCPASILKDKRTLVTLAFIKTFREFFPCLTSLALKFNNKPAHIIYKAEIIPCEKEK